MNSLFNRADYSISEKNIKSGLPYLKVEPQNGLIQLFPAQAFELACFLIDWVRDVEEFTDSDYHVNFDVLRPLAFEYIDQFTYKITENERIVGRAIWDNPDGRWKAFIDNSDIELAHRYRHELFDMTQREYDKLGVES